jgi:hypothetical protein
MCCVKFWIWCLLSSVYKKTCTQLWTCEYGLLLLCWKYKSKMGFVGCNCNLKCGSNCNMKWVVVGQNILWAGPARFKKTWHHQLRPSNQPRHRPRSSCVIVHVVATSQSTWQPHHRPRGSHIIGHLAATSSSTWLPCHHPPGCHVIVHVGCHIIVHVSSNPRRLFSSWKLGFGLS